jgi:hypothetical protein
VAGWSYQVVVRLSFERDSWVAPVAARRVEPQEDTDKVAAEQVKQLVDRLPERADEPLFVFDGGYDPVRLQFELQETAAQILVRMSPTRAFWTWLILAAYTQLRLAHGLVADRKLPWEKRPAASKLTPYRVLRSFATVLPALGTPAEAPKPRGRSPGRPKGRLSGPAKKYPAIKKAA